MEDVQANITGQPNGQIMYGDSLTHEWAWKNMGIKEIPGGGVNRYVAWNGKILSANDRRENIQKSNE